LELIYIDVYETTHQMCTKQPEKVDMKRLVYEMTCTQTPL